MKRKFMKMLSALLMVISMTGCTSVIGMDTQALISPPKANVDQQEIHQLLQGESSELVFIYPKTGEYRSAIIMEDFTGDKQEDALGFTQLEQLETGVPGIRVQFLVKDDNGWRSLGSFDNVANAVDRVCFGDLNGDGQQDILIGWGSTQTGTATLGVYLYENGGMREILFETKYDEMILTDFDENGIKEVYLTQKAVIQDEPAESTPGKAQVYTLKDGQVTPISETEASSSVTKFTSIVFGAVNGDMMGVVVDGAVAEGSMLSQVFYLDEERQLRSVPRSPNDPEIANPFSRPSSPFTAMDINKDNIIEIPRATRLPAISDEAVDSTSFLVEWCELNMDNDSGYISVLSTFMNISEGYWFSGYYPWFKTEVTSENNTSTRTVTYYQVETTVNEAGENEQVKGPAIFSIRAFNRSEWDSLGVSSGYEKLLEKNDQIYAVASHTQERKYILALEKIKESFTLISE